MVCFVVIALLSVVCAVSVAKSRAVSFARSRALLAVVALAVLPRTADAQVTFVVDSTRSGMWVDADVSTIFGSDADRDSTGLSGSFALEVDDQTVRITSGKLFFAHSLRLDFSFGFTGSITAVTEPMVLSLEVIGAGPTADLIDGAFSQDRIVLEFRGELHLSGDGIFETALPDDPQEVAAASTVTLTGSVEQENGTYHLVLPLHFEGNFDLGSGSDADIAMQGTVYASGLVSSAIDDRTEQPSELVVTDHYPRPVRDRVRLELSVERSQEVRVELFDVRGRRVVEPVNVFLGAGRGDVSIDVSPLSSGFYVAVVTGTSRRVTVPLVVVR